MGEAQSDTTSGLTGSLVIWDMIQPDISFEMVAET